MSCQVVTYALRLEGGRFYIGQSTKLKRRLTEHFKGYGAAFTRKFPPIEVVCIREGDCEKDMTIYARNKYGKDKVRGAGWCVSNHIYK